MVNAVVMSVLLVVAFTTFGFLVGPRLWVLTKLRRDERFDHLLKRFDGMMKFAGFQWRMPRDPVAGFAHIFIYGGFMTVSLATVMAIGHAFSPGWRIPGLSGQVGNIYNAIKESVEVLVLVGCSYALWRRLKPSPSRVGRSWEGVFVLCMISALMLTDFIWSGGELAGSGAMGSPYTPVGNLLAQLLAPLGAPTAHIIGVGAWWIHCVLVLAFLNFLPLGKHFHVITGFPNVFFKTLRPLGEVAKIDLENSEKFGIATSADLTWQMALNTYSCTECGRCNVYCPTVLTHKPLSHRELNKDIKHILDEDRATLLSGDKTKVEALLPIVSEGRINPDTIWACTTCGSCEQECPVFIEQVPRIIQMRQNKVLMEGDIAPELARAYKGMENNSNPWGIGFDKRDEWAEGLDIPRLADLKDGSEVVLYWIGCAGSFDDRNKKITLAMVKILKAAGVNFAILGKEEGCTGDPARRTGNEYLFQMLAQQNVETMNNYKVKNILTNCPHCMHTIKVEYPQFGGNYEVVHHTTFIDNLLKSGQLKLTQEVKTQVAYHDSCYIGRYHGIYDAPRDVVNAIPGASLVELTRNRSRSVCCGAGGGRFWMEEHIGERINEMRANEALEAKTDTVGSNCPFCLIMLRDGVAAAGREDVRTQDIAELVASSI